MSGFEVAGLVLGALPLVFSALEGYRKLAEKAGFWRDIRHKYQIFKIRLECQRLDFIATIRVSLLPLVTAGDNSQIRHLIDDPLGDGWKDARIAALLEKKLQGQYQLYEEIVGEIRQVVLELESELSVDSNFQEPIGPPSV